ncbi:MAG: hypothetical protein Salg2KO_10050 [Salibacteraceae bacterium]
MLVAFGCGTDDRAFKSNISEGIIEYQVTYPELDSDNIMLEMLPSKMVMKFKDNKYKSKLETTAGIVEMSVMADYETQKMYNLVKIFSDRYALELDKDAAIALTNKLPQFDLVFKDDAMKIADANCQKAELDFGGNRENYVFYYTDEIDLKNPNWCTPYNGIEGVLLDYRIENYGMNMHLRATRIVPQVIDDSEFEITDDYEFLSPLEFDKLVVKNMEIFME